MTCREAYSEERYRNLSETIAGRDPRGKPFPEP